MTTADSRRRLGTGRSSCPSPRSIANDGTTATCLAWALDIVRAEAEAVMDEVRDCLPMAETSG